MTTDDDRQPVFSVIVPAYNAGTSSLEAFAALAEQQFDYPFEIVVVDSGPLSVGPRLERRYPQVRLVQSQRRLGPGAARNAGVEVARGKYIAFCSVDTPPTPRWLAERYVEHAKGFALVAGAIANGTPRHAVGTAGYLLEYSALVPDEAVLRRQLVPHALSFERSVLARLGPYPEDVLTGEDTIVNERAMRAGLTLSFAPGASVAHRNPTSLREMFAHAYKHGRGLAQCMDRYDHRNSVVDPGDSGGLLREVYEFACVYAARGLLAKWRRLRGCSRLRAQLLLLSPLILLASSTTGVGVVAERFCSTERRRRSSPLQRTSRTSAR